MRRILPSLSPSVRPVLITSRASIQAFCFAALVGASLSFSGCKPPKPYDPAQANYSTAEDFVRGKLRVPSSAKFDDLGGPETEMTELGGGFWDARGIVESQNAMGVLLRNRWEVIFQGGGKTLYYNLDGQEVGNRKNALATIGGKFVPAADESKPTPPLAVRHFAPEGTFFITEYVSAHTPRGVVGFEPGRKVHFVSADEAKNTLRVSDGNYEVDVQPTQLTNDMDLAALIGRQDQESQRQLAEAQRLASESARRVQLQIDINHAQNVAHVRTGASIGGTATALDRGSSAASSYDRSAQANGYVGAHSYYGTGSPYYYLHRSSSLQRVGGGAY